MNSLDTSNLLASGQSNLEQNQKLYNYSQFKLAAVSNEKSADITLVTKEGDKVTLSADTRFEAAYATYNRKARMNGADTESRGQLSAVNIEREITISVEGDLNDGEKKEIKKLMREIFKMMKNFLAGQGGTPNVSAMKDIELDTLATVEAKFEVSRNALEVNHTSAEYVTNASVPIGESDRDVGSMDRLIDRMSTAVRDSEAGHDRFLKYFEHRPSRASDEYLEQVPDARKMRKMVRRIMAGLFHQLENMSNIAKVRHPSEDLADKDTILEAETVM